MIDAAAIDWEIAEGLIAYPQALSRMTERQNAIRETQARELIWLLEHPPLYTGGTSADPAELLHRQFPVYDAGRGGRYTYHGPGQRVGYVMLDLAARGKDVRCFVHALEGWVIDALAQFRTFRRGVPKGGSESGATREPGKRPKSGPSVFASVVGSRRMAFR